MTGFSARRLVTAIAVCSASAVAFVLPSAASATSITAQGSTLQEIAQHKYFIPDFEAKHPGDTITYTGTGSGAGLKAWGNAHTCEVESNEYVGTDQPPNATQKASMEKSCEDVPDSTKAKVLSIPTLQAAVAIIYHLPSGCTSVSSKAKKQTTHLALNAKTLEEIFAHKITEWGQIKEEGDTFAPAGCASGKPIIRVVRLEGSGTTAITKKWFYQENQNEVDTTTHENWNELAENNSNLNWPEEGVNLVRGKGTPGIVAETEKEAGSIGYANLANAYEEGKFKGELKTQNWAVVENKGGKKPTYANPEKPGAVIAKSKPKKYKEGESNCAATNYVNGPGHTFPPESTEEVWNEVSAATSQVNYPICGFTYDLSAKCFSDMEPTFQPEVAQVALVKEYFEFMVKEGPKIIVNGTDYLGLPENANPKKNVKLIAEEGTKAIC